MPLSLAAVIAAPPSGRRRAVLVDCHDYAQAVLLQGKPVPWSEPMAYCNFFGQAQGLLSSDLALLNLDRFYAYRLRSSEALREAMAAKNRTGFALRTLLGDADLLRDAVEFATTFSKTQRAPVVLQVPSPMRWLVRTHRFSGAADATGLDADDAENASMYVADWLRAFAGLPLASVLLDDRPLAGDDNNTVSVPLGTYSPVHNVTDHYGWTLGLRRADGVQLAVAGAGVGVGIELDGPAGVVIPAGFWPGSSIVEPPAGEFLLAEIPETAVPEHVLARLATLP